MAYPLLLAQLLDYNTQRPSSKGAVHTAGVLN